VTISRIRNGLLLEQSRGYEHGDKSLCVQGTSLTIMHYKEI